MARVDLYENISVQRIVEIAAFDRLTDSTVIAQRNGISIQEIAKTIGKSTIWTQANLQLQQRPSNLESSDLSGSTDEMLRYHNAYVRAGNIATGYTVAALRAGTYPLGLNAITRIDCPRD